MPSPTFFASATQFRAWLAEHGGTRTELIVGFWKVGSGRPSMSWPESVDEALCFGWIDGVRARGAAAEVRATTFKPLVPHLFRHDCMAVSIRIHCGA